MISLVKYGPMPIGVGQPVRDVARSIWGAAGGILFPTVAVGAGVATTVAGLHPLAATILTVSSNVLSNLTADKVQNLIERLGESGSNHDLEKVVQKAHEFGLWMIQKAGGFPKPYKFSIGGRLVDAPLRYFGGWWTRHTRGQEQTADGGECGAESHPFPAAFVEGFETVNGGILQLMVMLAGNRWPEWPEHIRVTVGTYEDVGKFNAALDQVLKEGPAKA